MACRRIACTSRTYSRSMTTSGSGYDDAQGGPAGPRTGESERKTLLPRSTSHCGNVLIVLVRSSWLLLCRLTCSSHGSEGIPCNPGVNTAPPSHDIRVASAAPILITTAGPPLLSIFKTAANPAHGAGVGLVKGEQAKLSEEATRRAQASDAASRSGLAGDVRGRESPMATTAVSIDRR